MLHNVHSATARCNMACVAVNCVGREHLANAFVEDRSLARKIVALGSGRAIHPITPLDLGLFTVRRAAGGGNPAIGGLRPQLPWPPPVRCWPLSTRQWSGRSAQHPLANTLLAYRHSLAVA